MKRVSFVLLCLAASLPAADVGGSDVIQELQKYYFSVPQNSPARYFANSAANFAPHDIFRVRYGIEADGRSVAQAQHSLLLLRDKIRLIELCVISFVLVGIVRLVLASYLMIRELPLAAKF